MLLLFGNVVLLRCYSAVMGLSPGQELRILELKYSIPCGSKSRQEGAETTSVSTKVLTARPWRSASGFDVCVS